MSNFDCYFCEIPFLNKTILKQQAYILKIIFIGLFNACIERILKPPHKIICKYFMST